ncbi:MAG: methyltransferase [Leucobacter sp.]
MKDELIDALRQDLDDAGFREDAVVGLLGDAADAARRRGVFSPGRRALAQRPSSPLATLASLFLFGDSLVGSRVDAALPNLRTRGATELGLLEPQRGDEAESVHAALSLNPVVLGPDPERDAWWVISDLDDQLRRGPARPDHVMGVGGATRSLISQSPVPAAGRALELGTGCGIVSMHLARAGAEHVVATDVSERALTLARANARLNQVDDRIEFRSGSLFEPVVGEHFDLILSNPPFVITPRTSDNVPAYTYRDGGLPGDDLAAAVVRDGPGHLTEGGMLLCLANWESPWGSDGLERVRDWIESAVDAAGPLHAWVIERDRVSPLQYAETWVRDGGVRPGDPDFEGLLEAWLQDFENRRVVAVGLGSIRVRRPATKSTAGLGARTEGGHGVEQLDTIVHLDRAAGSFATGQVGALLDAAFDAGIAAQSMTEKEVLALQWTTDAAVTEERDHRPGEEAPRAIRLVTDRPIARRVTADTLLAAAVGACDGELTLGQISEALATLLEVEPQAVSDALVTGVRELAWFGMLASA